MKALSFILIITLLCHSCGEPKSSEALQNWILQKTSSSSKQIQAETLEEIERMKDISWLRTNYEPLIDHQTDKGSFSYPRPRSGYCRF